MILQLGKLVHGRFEKAALSDSAFRKSYSPLNKLAQFKKN